MKHFAMIMLMAVIISVVSGGLALAEEQLKLVFITCAVNEAFFEPVKQGMQDAAAMMGVQADFIGTEGVDLEAQAAMVTKAVEDGYDGVALNVIDAEAFTEVTQAAMAQGVPVVAFNVDATNGKGSHLSFIQQDFYAAGQTIGNKAAPALADGAKVLFTVHHHGISALDDRLKGIQDALKEQKNAVGEVIATGTDPGKAAEMIADELKADPDIQAVFCTGQADTEGAGLAMEKFFPDTSRYVAGFDLSPEILRLIKAGYIAFTIDQQPYTQGFYPVIQLVLNIRYGLSPSNIDAGAGIVMKDNVDSVMKLSAEGYR